MKRSAMQLGIRRLRQQLAIPRAADESDEQLLQAFLHSRDEAAFAVLVRRHGPMVLHVSRRVLGHQQDAEDAFQATFLVLARNAASLHKKASLASWLHGTAYRIAMKAKQSADRRRKYEAQTPTRSTANPSEELPWREVRALLDEEIARLPETCRSVFVLCCLENLSQAEAGNRLGLKERTVSNRLAAARKRLGQRLTRRGVELTALLGVASLATPSSAALPAGLMATTVEAVLAMAAGEGLAGVVSASVAELVKSASVAMMMSKAKITTVVLLAMSMVAGASVWAYRGVAVNILPSSAQPAEPPRAKANENKAASPKLQAVKAVEIKGRVLDPEGKPKVGAKLLLLGEDGKITELGITAADGRFTVAIPKEATYRYLVAQADGLGIDFIGFGREMPAMPVELRLVKDQAIRGRIVNTEGRPVAGVRVAIKSLNIYADNSLDPFLLAWKKRHFQTGLPQGVKGFWSDTGSLYHTTIDAAGRFALHGIGVERVAGLRFSGAGIAAAEMWIVNRAGFDPKPYNQATRDNIPKGLERFASPSSWMLHGPDVSVVAEAEKPIRGVVKDADTGKGRPGAIVRLTRRDEGQLEDVWVKTTTGVQGRYQLHGAHKAKRYMLEVEDDSSAGYMPSQIWADDTAGYDPITVEIGVKKGVIVTGKVIDQATGQSVPGLVYTGVLVNNPFAKEYPPFNDSASGLAKSNFTAEDGVFRIVTIPGPVLLMGDLASGRVPGGPAERMKYKPAAPDPKYPQYFMRRSENVFWEYKSFEGGSAPLQGIFCKVLHIKPGVAVVKQDIVLERASALTVTIQDAEGRPLSGVWATGIGAENWHSAVRIEKDSCSAYDLKAGKPRLMVFYHPERKLAGSLMPKGDGKQQVVVKLSPAGSIKGRLLDADGKPLAGVAVEVGYWDREAEEVHQAIHKVKQVVTDATGAFTFDELIPERKFYISSLRRGKSLFEEGWKRREPILHEVKPSECRDLGTLKLKPFPE